MSLKKSIAVAGGTGTVGCSIICALLPHREYSPIILSRATRTNPPGTSTTARRTTPERPGEAIVVETRYVDYTSIAHLARSPRDVDVLISAVLIPYQLHMLEASIEAGVSRFAPSEFALSQKWHSRVDIDQGKRIVWEAVAQRVTEQKIDAAAFPCGMYMNDLGIGCPESKRAAASAGFTEGALMFHLDTAEPWVEMPLMEDGSWPDVGMTEIGDVGRFIVASLAIDIWDGRELGIVGETKNLRDIVRDIEEVLGRQVEVRTVEGRELEERLKGLRARGDDFMAQIETQYMMVCGQGGSVVEGALSELCPEVKPMSIRGYLEMYWT